MLRTLRRFVLAESPSTEKRACDFCAELIAANWAKRDADVTLLPQKNRGAHIRVTWWPGTARPEGQLLVLGHYDTVYATGTLKTMPFRVRGGRAFGPGVFDMKAGIVQALYALEALQRTKSLLRKKIVFLWTSDEEIGSESSRRLIEAEARRSDAAFVLEPAFGPKGLIKTARKGVGEAEIMVHGRASHAGLAPQDGVNAIHELAAQIARIEKWNDPKAGATINADIIQGGTRVNVIAESARASLDLRALKLVDMRRLESRLHALKPIHRGAKIEVRGGFHRLPMERKHSRALYSRARTSAAQMRLTLGECTVGGGSDGNFTAALGIPTLDGLGAVGGGAHSAGEYVFIKSMPVRAALLASLLANS
ncbi:MAG TPA: M20 family metallopeptidase [Terriglobales bacterium]|nr:M20 family metallopeptidase [Terriglobales bacterium]